MVVAGKSGPINLSKWSTLPHRKSKKFNFINDKEAEQQKRKQFKSLNHFSLFLQSTRYLFP